MEKERLNIKAQFEKSRIKSTFENKTQFRVNIASQLWLDILCPIIDNIKRHEGYINEWVYPILDNFSYTENKNEGSWNETGQKLIYTQELHNAFLINYKLYIIERLENENKNTSLFNSTDALGNVMELIRYQESKEIIKFLKEI